MVKNLFMTMLFAASASMALAGVVKVGAGSYSDQFPGTDQAGRNGYINTAPQISGKAVGRPIPTNDWWSNELVSNHGNSMFNYPLGIRTQDDGLGILKNMFHQATMLGAGPLEIGLEGLSEPQTTVSDFSDWTVTFSWGGKLEATVAQASPFVYFTRNSSGKVTVKATGSFKAVGNILIITGSYNKADYAVYAPTGASWNVQGSSATSDLAGKNYFTALLLPDNADAESIAQEWSKYAFAFPADTRADYVYNPAEGSVTTTYTVTTDTKEGDGTCLMGLLPHHWGNLDGSVSVEKETYATVRGEMKMLAANSFSTKLRYSGILPTLPAAEDGINGFSNDELAKLVQNVIDDNGLVDWTDSYNDGQLINRLVQVGRIAKQAGNDELHAKAVELVKKQVERWLTYSQGDIAFMFYYHKEWTTMLGYPAGHAQDTNINDHHFHWGYLIHGATFVEEAEPGWKDQWGGMISLLIRDAASIDRNDKMFPYLRNFAPYAGHSWANGTANIGLGIDQESSSESMQFASALILWGEITGDKAVRDLGVYLYATERSAIEEYWFDVYGRNLEPSFTSATASRIFANSYDNQNFWGGGIAGSYGIQIYPVHAGSAYLVNHKKYARKLWNAMSTETGLLKNEPNDNIWYDTWFRFYAMLEPQKALDLYKNCDRLGGKFGESQAHTYQWIHALCQYGTPVQGVTANHPLTMALDKDQTRTYVINNYSSKSVSVNFSDGYAVTAPANTLYHVSVEGNASADEDPDPVDPSPVDPDDPTKPDDPDNPVVHPDYGEKIVTFTADQATQGTLAGDGWIKFSYNGSDVKVSVHFDGEYEGFAGPWLWNYTDGFAESNMSPDSDGIYSATLTGYQTGTTVKVACKVAFAGGMAVTPQAEYTIPTSTAISQICDDNTSKIYYNLQGIRVAEPTRGTYIVHQGNRSYKVIIK